MRSKSHLALAASLGMSPLIASAQPCGGMQDLGTLGGPGAYPMAVSPDGSVVVGWAHNAAVQRRPFRWTLHGGMENLGDFGGNYAEATAVSDDGNVVVGSATNTASQARPFRWTPSGGMQNLGTLGQTYIHASAVSADGAVVVGSANYPEPTRVFRWTVGGGMQNLGTLDGRDSWVQDLSPDGSVLVGNAHREYFEDHRAFRWTLGGGMQNLGTLGGDSSRGEGVSASGSVVVGSATDASGDLRAFRWTQSGGMQDLGTLGGTKSTAIAVSTDGSVVIGTADNTDDRSRAYRWTADGGMEDLGTLGGTQSYASDASSDGSVVVGKSRTYGLYAKDRAFRWTVDGGMQNLGSLTYDSSQATAVSADGSVVIGLARNGGALDRAFRWRHVIIDIDTHSDDNQPQHHTDRYTLSSDPNNDQSRLVLRRGMKPTPHAATADIDIEVIECFNPADHKLVFEAEHTFDGAPHIEEIHDYDTNVPDGEWGCILQDLSSPNNGTRTATMRLFIPADAPIGEYTFRVIAKTHADEQLDERSFPNPVVLLFNPWDPEDQTYMPDDEEREAYVLQDWGAMWQGYAGSRELKYWRYDQFTEDVFLTTLNLLDGLNAEKRASAAEVANHLTGLIRADGAFNGVLLNGRWCPGCPGSMSPADCLSFQLQCYSGGELPRRWQGSGEIFSRFRSGGTVSYGQCWTFGGVLTSALRTMGISSRPVTNYESASDQSPFDGEISACWQPRQSGSGWEWAPDSFWNYHVWCEAWLDRDGSSDDGWNVFDGTYGIGPVAVSRVKSGNHSGDFDTAFVIAEVDADWRLGQYDPNSGACVYPSPSANPYYETWVGRRITTLQVGNFCLDCGQDITHTYKTPESTPDPRGVSVVSVLAPLDVAMDEDIDGVIELTNPEAVADDFTCYVTVTPIAQDGARMGSLFGPVTVPLALGPNETGFVDVLALGEDILPWLPFTDTISIDAVVTRVSDDQFWFGQRLVRVRGLPVSVALDPDVRIAPGAQTTATIDYSNPLDVPLVNARILLATDAGLPLGADQTTETIELGDLAAGESGTVQRTLTGLAEGGHALLVVFEADDAVSGDAIAPIIVGYCPADWNRDTVYNTADFVAYLNDFNVALAGGDPTYASPDIREPYGVLNTADFVEYLNRFTTGCP